MTATAAGKELPTYSLLAHNYAEDSENKIHSDETARDYGFRGGLVPGVAVYAYMIHPVVGALGADWIARGTMSAKLIQPVYHGDRVTVRARVASGDPMEIVSEVFDSAGTLCATGRAAMASADETIDMKLYPHRPAPPLQARWPATIDSVKAGRELGSRDFKFDAALFQSTFVREMREESPIFQGPRAPWHPAFLPAQANFIVRDNVALGPWIHAASEVRHFAIPRDGEPLSLRGRVAEAFEKRGHEIAVFDLAMFGDLGRAIARVRHTAIIRPRRNEK